MRRKKFLKIVLMLLPVAVVLAIAAGSLRRAVPPGAAPQPSLAGAGELSGDGLPNKRQEMPGPPEGPPGANNSNDTNRDGASNGKRGIIVFTFDDGNESDYLFAYPALQKYGIAGTSYINPYDPDHHVKHKLSWDQIKQMYASGWDFGDHTYAHINLRRAKPDQIRLSMEMVNEAFKHNGLAIPKVLAYPYGSFDQDAVDVVKQYREQARLAFYQDDFVDLKNTDPYKIPSVSADMRSKKRLEGKEKLVDKACEENGVIVFRVHCMYAEKVNDMGKEVVQTSSKLFEQLVEYCVKKGCAFTTMDGLLKMSEENGMQQPQDR